MIRINNVIVNRAIGCSLSYKNPRPQPTDDKELGISVLLSCVVMAAALSMLLFRLRDLGRLIGSYVRCVRRRLG